MLVPLHWFVNIRPSFASLPLCVCVRVRARLRVRLSFFCSCCALLGLALFTAAMCGACAAGDSPTNELVSLIWEKNWLDFSFRIGFATPYCHLRIHEELTAMDDATGYSVLHWVFLGKAPEDVLQVVLRRMEQADNGGLGNPSKSLVTPLHLAAESYSLDIIRTMAARSPCSLLVRNTSNQTPADRAAVMSRDPEIVNFLQAEQQRREQFERERTREEVRGRPFVKVV